MLPVEKIDFRNKHISLNEGDNSVTDTFEMFELMEYTGLEDKNGKEIYEGDIVSDGVINYVVAFYAGAWCLKLGIEDCTWHSLYPVAHQREIVGNVYQNLELLKEGEK